MATPAPLRTAITELGQLADNDLRGLWGQVKTADQARDALHDVLPDLIRTYHLASAAISADWYDDIRDAAAARGRFRAITAADEVDLGAGALAGWGVKPLYSATPDWAAAKVLVAGGMQRRIANASRNTIMESSVQDPASRGWRREGSGECDFCSMLLGRGAVYSEATVDFLSHDHCNCSAVPEF